MQSVKMFLINEAIAEAERFIKRAKDWKKRINEDYIYADYGCKESAACKRASMDLSRVLTRIRGK